MIKKLILSVFVVTISLAAIAQTSQPEKKGTRPDIPGTFVLEIGVNRGLEAPKNFDIGFWGSRTANVYYQYDIRIFKSRFSFVPSIGLSLERYKFKNLTTLGYDAEDSLKLLSASEGGMAGVRKSQLITNYVELPLEIRYSSNPEDPGRSFKASIGGRIGYMYDSFNKIKYKEDEEMKRFKNKQDFNLTRLRYGVSAKIGVGNFSVFGYYNLTPLFEEGKAPGEKGGPTGLVTDFPIFTVGISLASF